jgi:16S rRNA (cytidine1402-2'-O)-methyltransferase
LTLAQGWTRTDTVARWKLAPAALPKDVPAVFSLLAQ